MSRLARRVWIARALAVVAFAVTLLLAAIAFARPGGGESYSGGGGGGGGGGWGGGGGGGGRGGGGADLLFLLFRLIELCFVEPVVGIPLLLVCIGGGIWFLRQSQSGSDNAGWSSGGYGDSSTAINTFQPPMPVARVRVRELLDRIRTFDPDFSPVLFEDFIFSLFSAAHEARGTHKLDVLAAYLQPNARAALTQLQPAANRVKGIVVGAMRFTTVAGLGPMDTRLAVRVEFESNYTETVNGTDRTYYAVEAWRFERDRSTRSKPADRARTLNCPNCGAGLENAIGGTCTYCKQTVDSGRFDWVVAAISLDSRQERGAQLTGTVAERGTDLPSVVDPSAPTRWAQLQQRDPALEWTSFQSRIGVIFTELQKAWSSREWERARAFVSDNLFQSYSYWMEMYARQGLRNVTENARISRLEIVRITNDKFFDAITLRVWASGFDYTLDTKGNVVAGSKSKDRPYSEYWTLIRGTSKRGPARNDGQCPNCGAPLKINMAGHCEYCRAKVTTGEFDWVLSRVEQDESYTG